MASSTTPSPGRLGDKVAIVTGSSSGIGRAIAVSYMREGAKVVCADITPGVRHEIDHEATATTFDMLQQEGGLDRSISVEADVSSSKDVQVLVEKAVQRFGRLDMYISLRKVFLILYNLLRYIYSIVNNVGIAPFPSLIHEQLEDDWDRTMGINARSVFLGSKYAITQMLKQEPHSSGDRGWIINIASVGGLIGVPRSPPYSASKGAVIQTTKQVAIDYAKHRIHCNAICPGYTKTPLLDETFRHLGDQTESLASLHPFRGLGEADDIAGPAVFLASADAKWITGVALAVDGGFTAQ